MFTATMLCFIVVTLGSLVVVSAGSQSTPNIVLMMADDLGIGDIGCFGNDTIRTPNIDRIAVEGVKLTHHLATASVCTPSRAAFMTGRYQIRFGMAPLDFIRVTMSASSTSGLPPSETTIGEIAKERGYKTGFIGKWHLGMNCERFRDFCHHPLNQGYDYFYGMPVSNSRDFGTDGLTLLEGRFPHVKQAVAAILMGAILLAYALKKLGIIGVLGFIFIVLVACIPAALVTYVLKLAPTLAGIVMRDFEVVEQPVNLETMSLRLVREGKNYLQERSKDQEPFLLHMNWIQTHTALHATPPFRGQSSHGPYGDEVEEMDWTVGEILNTLDDLGLSDNTFVYFTSDHGGHNEEVGLHGNREGGWNGIYRGGKGQGGMDGGIRVPTVARWPGKIPPGSVVDVPTSHMDVLPTVANIVQGTVPTDRIIDGVDIGDILQGEVERVPHDFLVHYCADMIHSVRYTPADGSDVFKAFYGTPKWLPGTEGCGFICGCHGKSVNWHNPPILYNIAKDPSEKVMLDSNDPKYRPILAEIESRVEEHKKSIVPGESQFWHSKLVPRFWLQPCCDSCYCQEEV